jgi:hypothetical protein
VADRKGDYKGKHRDPNKGRASKNTEAEYYMNLQGDGVGSVHKELTERLEKKRRKDAGS